MFLSCMVLLEVTFSNSSVNSESVWLSPVFISTHDIELSGYNYTFHYELEQRARLPFRLCDLTVDISQVLIYNHLMCIHISL